MSEQAGWYLRKEDGTLYGPSDVASLQEWAADGRIAPEDLVSTDGSLWRPAPELAPLGMRWMVELADGQFYGPAHISAFADLIKDGTLTPAARVRTLDTKEQMTLAQALVLIAEAAPTPAPLRPVRSELPAAIPPPSASASLPAAAVPAAAAVPEKMASWQTMAREKDQFEKESAKWRTLYEQAHTRSLELEQRQEEIARGRESELLAAQSALEHAEKEIGALKKQQEELARTLPGGEAGMIGAYRELSRNFEILAEQFAGSSEELHAAQEALPSMRKEFEERVRFLEQQLAREREQTDQARRRLSDMEKSHLEIVQSFREMNDRYIRMREQLAAGRPPDASPADAPPEEAAPGGPRIKLRR